MLSIQELIDEISSIKQQSQELSAVVKAANQELGRQGMVIAGLVQGSRTGQDAVRAVQITSAALKNAGVSMAELSRTCDTCIQNLKK